MNADRAALLRRGRHLEVFTVGWNSLEGLVSVAFGALAGSIALVGFGIDSFIETSSGLILLWRLQTHRDAADAERAEARALKLVGLSLIVLALYIAWDSATSLLARERPDESVPGIAIAALSLVVMPILARAKRRVAAALNSRALQADSFQTDVCMYLSAILLGGLLLNATLGWWWADPLAALVMIPLIVREGREALRGERCGDCGACGTPACICNDAGGPGSPASLNAVR
jgi:divalent metal cation (Fe/Co/Zn/Cd) transporter